MGPFQIQIMKLCTEIHVCQNLNIFLLCGDMKMFTVTPTDMNKRKEFMWNGNIVTVITAYQHFFMHNC